MCALVLLSVGVGVYRRGGGVQQSSIHRREPSGNSLTRLCALHGTWWCQVGLGGPEHANSRAQWAFIMGVRVPSGRAGVVGGIYINRLVHLIV